MKKVNLRYQQNLEIGEYVALDEVVAMVETDKITVDIRSPEAGTLTQLFAKVGDTIEVGSPFFEIDTDGKKADGSAKSAAEAPKTAEAPKKDAKATDAPKKADAPPPSKAAEKKADKPVSAPAPLPVFSNSYIFDNFSRIKKRQKRTHVKNEIEDCLKT